MQKKIKRKKYYVNRQIQGALIRKVMHYWLLSLFVVGGLTFLGWMFIYPGIGSLIGPDALVSQALPVFVMGIVATSLLLPIALRDSVLFSNRFVGPMVRIQRAMGELAAGQPVRPIKLREGDYWQDFAESFNQMLQRVEAHDSCFEFPRPEERDSQRDQSTPSNFALSVESLSSESTTEACQKA